MFRQTFQIKPQDYLKTCLSEALKFKKTLKKSSDFMNLENQKKYLKKIGKLNYLKSTSARATRVSSNSNETVASASDTTKTDTTDDDLDPKIYKIFKKHDFDRFGMKAILETAEDMKVFQDCLERVSVLDSEITVGFGASKALFGLGFGLRNEQTLSSPRVCR